MREVEVEMTGKGKPKALFIKWTNIELCFSTGTSFMSAHCQHHTFFPLVQLHASRNTLCTQFTANGMLWGVCIWDFFFFTFGWTIHLIEASSAHYSLKGCYFGAVFFILHSFFFSVHPVTPFLLPSSLFPSALQSLQPKTKTLSPPCARCTLVNCSSSTARCPRWPPLSGPKTAPRWALTTAHS